MKRALLGCLTACSMTAVAADFGVGVSAKSDDAWIYVPISVTPKLRLEPSIRFFDGKSTSQTQSSRFNTTITDTVTSTGRSTEIGLGLFGLVPISEAARLYYGARGAYIDTESKLRFETRIGAFQDVDEQKQSSDGYRFSPTLGFEYLINGHLSIGGEAAWFYQDIDAKRTNGSTLTEGDSKSNGTDTHLIIRYWF